MSYDGQKTPSCPPPPPWQRNSMGQAGQQISNLQTHLGLANQALVTYAQNQPVYNTNIAMAQQQGGQQQAQNLSLISQISGSLASQLPPNQIFTQTVSYPAQRTLNPIAFNQQPSSTQQSHQTSQQTLPLGQTAATLAKSHGVFNGIGVVTKMQGDIGFIDKEVFFNKNVCAKGSFPKVGDRVLVEVTYNSKMPFKWNATRVQVVSTSGNSTLSMQSQNRSMMSMTHKSSSYSTASPSENGSNYSRVSRSRRPTPSPPRISDRSTSSRSRDPRLRDQDPRSDEDDRKRRRHSREKERYRERRDSTPERRDRSPPRRSPPRKKRTRAIPRYMVQVPKVSLTVKDADVLAVKRRYNNLYIPSDFFYTNIKWPDAFPPNVPFSIHKPCSFHIMRKDVEPVVCGELPAEPADADYLFSAKVMLMGSPPIEEMYSKCITTAEEKDKEEERDVVHPSRLINFLVGVRGKNEAMAIGGPWSPSVDGENPQSDVSVLIRTAIRSCKSLTGIDLSNCTQWYRFVELYYRRGEVVQKGRIVPPRIETVVIFLPDVRSCIPTRLEWDALHGKYRRTLDRILLQDDTSPSDGESLAASGVDQGVVVPKAESPEAAAATENETTESADAVKEEKAAPQVEEPSPEKPLDTKDDAATEAVAEKAKPVPAVTQDGGVATEKDEIAEDVKAKKEPTHYSKLDAKTMKIQELRDELSARSISFKGLKPQLALRLAKALKAEAEVEATQAEKETSEEKEEPEQLEEPKEVEEVKENDPPEEPQVVEEVKEVEQTEVPEVVEEVKETEEPTEDTEAKVEDKPEETENPVVVEQGEIVEEPEKVEETEESKESEEVKETEEPKEPEEVKETKEPKESEEVKENQEPKESEEVKESDEPMEADKPKDVEEPVETEKVDKEEPMETENSREVEEPKKAAEEEPKVPEVTKEAEDSQEAEMFNESDMADLVIIDEVGGSKAPEKAPEEKPKKIEKKPLDEREKQALEKKYTLPDSPQIIVHPSKMAKGGKFDCTIMSLSVLLDYRPEDTKEHTFEVSLFAELFNEMLLRDFGFNIYKALNMIPEKNKEAEVKKEDKKVDTVMIEDSPGKDTKDPKKQSDEKEAKEKDVDETVKNKKSDREKDSKSDRDKDSKSDREKSERSKPCDESDDDCVSVKSGEKRKREKDRQKYYTALPDLLLSFVYFDQSHCGYIFEKDVEDLFYTLGLDLSRAQIRKLVGKSISRDALYYRKLTDQVKEDNEETTEDSAKEKENLEDSLPDDVVKGNKIYLPVFKEMIRSLQTSDEPPLKKIKTEDSEEASAVPESSGFVVHNGGIVDVEKLLGQMSRSEKALEDTEKLLVDLRKQVGDLQSANSKANSKIKDLSSDLRSVGRKLSDTEQTLNSTQKRCNDYYSILSSVNDRVSTVFSKSEKSHRSDSRSREPRERDRDSKESSKSEATKKDD